MQHSDMQHSDMQHSDMQHSDMQHSDMQHSDMQHSDMQHSDMQHSDMQHSDMQHSDMQHSDTQHSDMQHSDMQHSDMQHSDMQQRRAAINVKIISSIVKFFSPLKGSELSLLPPTPGVLSHVQSGRGVMLTVHKLPPRWFERTPSEQMRSTGVVTYGRAWNTFSWLAIAASGRP